MKLLTYIKKLFSKHHDAESEYWVTIPNKWYLYRFVNEQEYKDRQAFPQINGIFFIPRHIDNIYLQVGDSKTVNRRISYIK